MRANARASRWSPDHWDFRPRRPGTSEACRRGSTTRSEASRWERGRQRRARRYPECSPGWRSNRRPSGTPPATRSAALRLLWPQAPVPPRFAPSRASLGTACQETAWKRRIRPLRPCPGWGGRACLGWMVPVHGEPRKYTACASAPAERFGDELGDLGGVRRGPDASLPQRLALGLRRALAAGDDGAGVPHGLALGGREASDVGHDRDAHLFPHVLGRELLGVPADLPDHHGALRLGVGLELAQDLDEVRPYDGVAADPDGSALSDLPLRELVDDLVGQRAAAAYDADVAEHEDVLRHYGDVRLLRRVDAGTVRPDEGRVFGREIIGDPHHVVYGDAFCNAADGRESRIQRLEDGVGGEGWGDEDHARVRARMFDGLLYSVEDRDSFVVLPALTRRHSCDHPGAAL